MTGGVRRDRLARAPDALIFDMSRELLFQFQSTYKNIILNLSLKSKDQKHQKKNIKKVRNTSKVIIKKSEKKEYIYNIDIKKTLINI